MPNLSFVKLDGGDLLWHGKQECVPGLSGFAQQIVEKAGLQPCPVCSGVTPPQESPESRAARVSVQSRREGVLIARPRESNA